jgi:hypothetical protein
VAARSFYARKEPLFPLYAVLIRLAIFLAIGVTGVTLFKEIGAPVIAFAEIALLIEAVILFRWLSKRTHEPIHVGSAVVRGVVAGLLGAVATFSVARGVSGNEVIVGLLAISVGESLALAYAWPEVKLLFNL